jgi:Leucine-rich repeat (LRR) protein
MERRPRNALIIVAILFVAYTTAIAATITHAEHALTQGPDVCAGVTEIPGTECEALRALYDSTQGQSWTSSTGWLQTTTPCEWYGVSCSQGHVVLLALFSNNLSGTIPPELAQLSHLQRLNLSGNRLTGTIPPELGDLPDLRYLLLSDNLLSGTIPQELSALKNLTYLFLYSNQLSGEIPPQLGELTDLENLSLAENELSGAIPSELGTIETLNYINIALNQLTGEIPPELGNLGNLEVLKLYSNHLSGPIPDELGDLSALEDLWLYANRLEDAVPSELGNLMRLERLFLQENQLSSVTSALCSPPVLVALDLSYNKVPTAPACVGAADPDWAETQTVAPMSLSARIVPGQGTQLTWAPIQYTADGGYYEIGYALAPSAPYTTLGTTANKSNTSFTVTGLPVGVTYSFSARTYTPAHGEQQNHLWSDYSGPVTGYAVEVDSTASIARDPEDGSADLQWTAIVAASHYEVFRSPQPYFSLEDNGVEQLADSPAPPAGEQPTFSDPVGATTPGTAYFYAVLSVDSSSLPLAVTEELGAVTFGLTPGAD